MKKLLTNHMRKILSLIVAAAIIFSAVPVSAAIAATSGVTATESGDLAAATSGVTAAAPLGVAPVASAPGSYIFDVSEGGITVDKGTGANTITVTYGASPTTTAEFANTQEITITGTNIEANETNIIIVKTGVTANITLQNVIIRPQGNTCAFELKGTAKVNLTLEGTNTLQSGPGFAGLQVPSTAELTITAASTGSLTATGGSHSAGIGGGADVAGGTVNANSGELSGSVGIGAGGGGNGGTVNIGGGTVTASGSSGAGIGGNNVTVNISGGAVTAMGYGSDGLGSGAGISGTVNISGGTVTATGGGNDDGGAGIGGGRTSDGGTVNISGGTVTATGGGSGAGIGGGGNGSRNGGTLKITGGSVKANNMSGSNAAKPTIDGSNGSDTSKRVYLATLTVGSSAVANEEITGGSIDGYAYSLIKDVKTDGGGKVYFYLPAAAYNMSLTAGGKIYSASSVAVNTSNTGAATLAALNTDISLGDVTINTNGTYTITGTTTTNKIKVSPNVEANITLQSVDIQLTYGCAFDMTDATVNLTLDGTNTLTSGDNKAGLQVPYGAELTIGGTGKLTATGGGYGAGIGGSGSGGGSGNVNINGGTVTATGHDAGIGGAGGEVTISGGTVTATGSGGAGIGNASGQIGGVTLKITGGSVKANNMSGSNAAIPTSDGSDGSNTSKRIYLATLTVGESPNEQKNAAITGGTIETLSYTYGFNNVITDDDGKVYFYLPEATSYDISLTTAGGTYSDPSVTVEANNSNAATLMRNTYGISLDLSADKNFNSAQYGYGAQTAHSVTVTNTGNKPTGALTVALSGNNPTSFTLSTDSISSIAAGGNGSFTVAPNTGLAVGIYTATVTVSGGNIVAHGFNVRFEVTFAPPAGKTDTEKVADDKAALTIDSIKGNNSALSNITANLTLPTSGANGSAIAWSSGDTSVVTNSGAVTRPANGAGDKTVTLTATISSGGVSETVTFTLTVKEQSGTGGGTGGGQSGNGGGTGGGQSGNGGGTGGGQSGNGGGTGGGSTSSVGSSSDSGDTTPSTTTPQITSLDGQSSGTLNDAIGKAAEAVETTEPDVNYGKSPLNVKLKNISEITSKNVAAIIKKAKELGTKAKVSSDTIDENGRVVEVRVTVDPEQITETVRLDGYVRQTETRAAANTFQRYFENPTAAMRLGQQGAFGQTAKVAAKLDLTNFDTENIYIYRYDRQTGTYKLINTPYRIDANGYLHFYTDLGGFIIVSSGPLTKRGDIQQNESGTLYYMTSAKLNMLTLNKADSNVPMAEDSAVADVPLEIHTGEAITPMLLKNSSVTGGAEAALMVSPILSNTPEAPKSGGISAVWAVVMVASILLSAMMLWAVIPRKDDPLVSVEEYRKKY